MNFRRMRPLSWLESSQSLKTSAAIYIIVSLIVSVVSIIAFLKFDTSTLNTQGSQLRAFLVYTPLVLLSLHILGIGLIFLLARRCHRCASGPMKRISAAMEKMGKGDLGWKITLRRKDELADVAASITDASQSLARRINRIQIRTRQLSEVEDYIIDTLSSTAPLNPYMLKALRKLKITTSRLNSDIDEFQVSVMDGHIMTESTSPRIKEPVEIA